MKKTNIVTYVGLAIVAYLAYKVIFKQMIDIDTIISSGNYGSGQNKSAAKAQLKSFEKNFIKSWADAVRNNELYFTYQSKIFVTKGGKAKV